MHDKTLNSLSPTSDPHPISPNINTAWPNRCVMRNNEMITKDKNNVVMLEQILSSSTIRNVWRTVWRRFMLMFGLKGLERPHGRLNVLGKIVNGTLSDNWLLLLCKRGYSYSFTSALEKFFCYRCMYCVVFLLYSQHFLLFYDSSINCYFLPCSSSVA